MKNQVGQAIQPPAVAGLFYPAGKSMLANEVDQLLAQAQPEKQLKYPAGRQIKALIAPHAGYTYSGKIAAAAYAQLIPQAKDITRVVIFGPAHRIPFRGLATTTTDRFETPLGTIPIDRSGREVLSDSTYPVQLLDAAFDEEHALEVQLPFLQRILGEFTLLPILVGDADPVEVERVIKQCWGGPETLIVVSSDLSHFHNYDTAELMDRSTTANIESLQPGGIGHGDACGRIPINGLLLAAKEKGLQVKTVARCNSGDTGGDRQRVVGYGAYAFT